MLFLSQHYKMTHTSIKLRAVTLHLLEKDILEVTTTPDYETTIDDIKEINEVTKSLFQDRSYYVLVVTSQGSSSSSEARELAAKESARKNIIAEAIVIENIAVRLAATVYMKVNRPKQKIKLFNSRQKALQWIHQLKSKNLES